MKKIISTIIAMVAVMSAVVYAAPVMVETVEKVSEEISKNARLDAEVADDAATMADTSNYIIPEGSKLVFDVPYNNGAAIANYQAVTKYGTYGADFNENGTVPSIVTGTNGDNKIYIDWKSATAVEYASVSNTGFTTADNALAIKNTATAAGEKYPLFYFRAGDGENNAFADGHYTICAELSVNPNTNLEYVQYSALFYNGGDKGLGSAYKKNIDTANGTATYMSMDVFVYQGKAYVYNNSGALVAVQTYTNSTVKKFGLIFIPKFTAASTSYVYIDDLQMYYKPLECAPTHAVVTFDANGKTVTDLPAKLTAQKGTLDLSQTKLSDVGTSRFVGWATTPTGKVATSITLSENTTLYAIWDDYYYAPEGEGKNDELVFASHFNSTYTTFGGKSVADAKISNAGSALSKISSGTVTFGGGNSRANYELKDISNTDDELVLTTKGTNASETWPALWLNAASPATLADGIYTWYAELSVKADNELEYIKFNPAASCKLSGTNKNLSGSKFDLPVDGTKIYATITAAVDNGNVYFGTNLTKFSGTYDVGTLYRIGWNFNVKAKTGTETNTKIFIDNLRVYYRPIHKALSYDENSIRVNSPAGIRFKASVNSFTRGNEGLTEYGFVVTRSVLLTEAGVSKNDFTLESDVAKVKGVSYGKVDGKDVDRIFETKGNETFFTAVVYNIPANMYTDVVVVRPYVKIGETVNYGDAMSASIYEVAQKLKTSENYENYKTVVDKILAGEEI